MRERRKRKRKRKESKGRERDRGLRIKERREKRIQVGKFLDSLSLQNSATPLYRLFSEIHVKKLWIETGLFLNVTSTAHNVV
jgi:hypothetical protein